MSLTQTERSKMNQASKDVNYQGSTVNKANYYESKLAQHGRPFLSWNSSKAHLYFPESLEGVLGEMADARDAEVVVYSDGGSAGGPMVKIEVGDFPIYMPLAHCDSNISPSSCHELREVSIFTADGEVFRVPAAGHYF